MSRLLTALARRPAQLAGAAALAGLLALALSTGVTAAGWTSAAITNTGDSARSGTLAFSHAYQATTCSLGPNPLGTQRCPGSIAPTGPTPSTGTDAITNTGSYPPGALAEGVAAASCGVVQLANAKATADPMLPRYATGFQAADPWGTASALSLDGSTAYASNVTSINRASLLGSALSIGVWFKAAPSSHGGGLIGLSADATAVAAGGADPVVWLDSTGHAHYGVKGTLGITSAGVSNGSYRDGSWHLATLTLTPALLGLTVTPTLYVDGTDVAGGTALGLLTSGSGYWHLGWTDLTGWDAATDPYFDGALSGGYVLTGTAQSPGTIASLKSASTAAAYASLLAGSADLWMLGDDGTTAGATPAYGGPFPVIGAANPCTMVDLAWTFTNPAGTAAPASPPTSLAGFADGTYHSVPAPPPTATQTSTITTSRAAAYNGYVSGLHLYAPLSFRVATAPPGGWSLTFTWPGATAAFIA